MNPLLRDELAGIIAEVPLQQAGGPRLMAHEDAISDAMDKVLEGIAITEMSWRTKLCNAEDAEMLQRAALVTHRLLEEARGHLATVKDVLDQQLVGGLA